MPENVIPLTVRIVKNRGLRVNAPKCVRPDLRHDESFRRQGRSSAVHGKTETGQGFAGKCGSFLTEIEERNPGR